MNFLKHKTNAPFNENREMPCTFAAAKVACQVPQHSVQSGPLFTHCAMIESAVTFIYCGPLGKKLGSSDGVHQGDCQDESIWFTIVYLKDQLLWLFPGEFWTSKMAIGSSLLVDGFLQVKLPIKEEGKWSAKHKKKNCNFTCNWYIKYRQKILTKQMYIQQGWGPETGPHVIPA